MNLDNLTELLQQSFRVTLGATASLVEALQDPQKRSENLDLMQLELNQLVTEWAQKGEITEQEARNFVDVILKQQAEQPNSTPTSDSTSTATETAPPDVELELQELTAQLAAMRIELEKLRNSDSSNQP